MKKHNYDDAILIKLRRKYSKDEVVSALHIRLSKVEQENGELHSEIDHLNHLLKEKNKSYDDKLRSDLRKEILEALEVSIDKKNRIISSLRKSNKDLTHKLNICKNDQNSNK